LFAHYLHDLFDGIEIGVESDEVLVDLLVSLALKAFYIVAVFFTPSDCFHHHLFASHHQYEEGSSREGQAREEGDKKISPKLAKAYFFYGGTVRLVHTSDINIIIRHV